MSSRPFDAIRMGSLDEVAKEFGLPSWESIEEHNRDSFDDDASDARETALEAALEEGKDEAEAEEIADAAAQAVEQERMDELYKDWKDAIDRTLSAFLENYELDLVEEAHVYWLYPTTSWRVTAEHLLETINGVGDFSFKNLRELLDSGPYGLREVVSAHLGFIQQHGGVYGTRSPRQTFDHHFR